MRCDGLTRSSMQVGRTAHGIDLPSVRSPGERRFASYGDSSFMHRSTMCTQTWAGTSSERSESQPVARLAGSTRSIHPALICCSRCRCGFLGTAVAACGLRLCFGSCSLRLCPSSRGASPCAWYRGLRPR